MFHINNSPLQIGKKWKEIYTLSANKQVANKCVSQRRVSAGDGLNFRSARTFNSLSLKSSSKMAILKKITSVIDTFSYK